MGERNFLNAEGWRGEGGAKSQMGGGRKMEDRGRMAEDRLTVLEFEISNLRFEMRDEEASAGVFP